MTWRCRWEDSGQREFKTKLLAYNQADCNALRLLTAELQSLSKAADSRADVDFTNKPKQLATPAGEQIHRLFDGILASAHEEYKRKKIALSGLVLPDKLASQSAPARKSVRPKKLSRPSKTIVVPRRRRGCSTHPEVDLRQSRKTIEHKLVDLVFTKTGFHRNQVHEGVPGRVGSLFVFRASDSAADHFSSPSENGSRSRWRRGTRLLSG